MERKRMRWERKRRVSREKTRLTEKIDRRRRRRKKGRTHSRNEVKVEVREKKR